jgi:hypothetical protein
VVDRRSCVGGGVFPPNFFPPKEEVGRGGHGADARWALSGRRTGRTRGAAEKKSRPCFCLDSILFFLFKN